MSEPGEFGSKPEYIAPYSDPWIRSVLWEIMQQNRRILAMNWDIERVLCAPTFYYPQDITSPGGKPK
jgi:hypothetical protein